VPAFSRIITLEGDERRPGPLTIDAWLVKVAVPIDVLLRNLSPPNKQEPRLRCRAPRSAMMPLTGQIPPVAALPAVP
jgi:hypothetical protein